MSHHTVQCCISFTGGIKRNTQQIHCLSETNVVQSLFWEWLWQQQPQSQSLASLLSNKRRKNAEKVFEYDKNRKNIPTNFRPMDYNFTTKFCVAEIIALVRYIPFCLLRNHIFHSFFFGEKYNKNGDAQPTISKLPTKITIGRQLSTFRNMILYTNQTIEKLKCFYIACSDSVCYVYLVKNRRGKIVLQTDSTPFSHA